jgi:hypothetical protein
MDSDCVSISQFAGTKELQDGVYFQLSAEIAN